MHSLGGPSGAGRAPPSTDPWAGRSLTIAAVGSRFGRTASDRKDMLIANLTDKIINVVVIPLSKM